MFGSICPCGVEGFAWLNKREIFVLSDSPGIYERAGHPTTHCTNLHLLPASNITRMEVARFKMFNSPYLLRWTCWTHAPVSMIYPFLRHSHCQMSIVAICWHAPCPSWSTFTQPPAPQSASTVCLWSMTDPALSNTLLVHHMNKVSPVCDAKSHISVTSNTSPTYRSGMSQSITIFHIL